MTHSSPKKAARGTFCSEAYLKAFSTTGSGRSGPAFPTAVAEKSASEELQRLSPGSTERIGTGKSIGEDSYSDTKMAGYGKCLRNALLHLATEGLQIHDAIYLQVFKSCKALYLAYLSLLIGYTRAR